MIKHAEQWLENICLRSHHQEKWMCMFASFVASSNTHIVKLFCTETDNIYSENAWDCYDSFMNEQLGCQISEQFKWDIQFWRIRSCRLRMWTRCLKLSVWLFTFNLFTVGVLTAGGMAQMVGPDYNKCHSITIWNQ